MFTELRGGGKWEGNFSFSHIFSLFFIINPRKRGVLSGPITQVFHNFSPHLLVIKLEHEHMTDYAGSRDYVENL